MTDGSISFQPAQGGDTNSTKTAADASTVRTQKWLCTAQGGASLSNGSLNLLSIALTIQPVMPDSSGNYMAAGASGYMAVSGSDIILDQQQGTVFTLTMSGIAPNYMSMADLKFLPGSTPSGTEMFGPRYGLLPSAPLSFSISGDPLPSFLNFDTTTGTLSPNGNATPATLANNNTIVATNALGTCSVSFKITI
jgi:hypothetical protein